MDCRLDCTPATRTISAQTMRTFLTSGLNSILAIRLAWRWRNKKAPAFALTPSSRVLVIELGGLGDTVHALPVLAALPLPVTVVCRDYVAELFELAGHRNTIGITKSRAGLARAIAELHGQEWDLVISTCWSTWATALALQLNATTLCGFWRPRRIEVFGGCGPILPVSHADHLATLRWKAVAPLGIPLPAPLPVAALTAGRDERTAGRVVIVPFSGDRRRCLTTAETHALIAALDSPVVLGGRADALRLKVFSGALITPSIRDLLAALGSARCVVTVNTGAMHLAAALGVKTVSIFRTTDPQLSGPIGPHVAVVRTLAEAVEAAQKNF